MSPFDMHGVLWVSHQCRRQRRHHVVFGSLEFSNSSHLESSNSGHLEFSNCGHLEFSNCGHLESSNIGRLEFSNCGHLKSSNIGQLEFSNCGHIEFSNCGHLESSNIGQLEFSNCGHLESSNCGHLESSNSDHLESSNSGHLFVAAVCLGVIFFRLLLHPSVVAVATVTARVASWEKITLSRRFCRMQMVPRVQWFNEFYLTDIGKPFAHKDFFTTNAISCLYSFCVFVFVSGALYDSRSLSFSPFLRISFPLSSLSLSFSPSFFLCVCLCNWRAFFFSLSFSPFFSLFLSISLSSLSFLQPLCLSLCVSFVYVFISIYLLLLLSSSPLVLPFSPWFFSFYLSPSLFLSFSLSFICSLSLCLSVYL